MLAAASLEESLSKFVDAMQHLEVLGVHRDLATYRAGIAEDKRQRLLVLIGDALDASARGSGIVVRQLASLTSDPPHRSSLASNGLSTDHRCQTGVDGRVGLWSRRPGDHHERPRRLRATTMAGRGCRYVQRCCARRR